MIWLPVSTVTPPAADPMLIGQVRDWLELTDNFSDAKLIGLIKAAAGYIQKQTGLRLFTQTVAMRSAGFCCPMRLPTGPIQSIASVQYLDSNGASQSLAGSVYEAPLEGYRPSLYLKDGQSWPATFNSPVAVTVTAIAGFGGINDQPEELRLAMMMLCAQWFDTRAGVSEKAMAEVPNGVAALLTDFLPSPLG